MVKWIICGDCKFYNDCRAGQNKTQNIDVNSPVYAEIGCYGYEQYYQQRDGGQLNLFSR